MQISHGLIVSCQAYEGDPLFGADIMAAMAKAAEQGGAVGIRANSPVDIAAIRLTTELPIIGIYKQRHPDSDVYITPTREAAFQVAEAGSDLIAIDATPRPRATGVSLAELIDYIHTSLHKLVVADVSCLAEAMQSERLGADVISTTMAGYTSYGRPAMDDPDLEFLGEVCRSVQIPVFGEGRFSEPWQVTQAFQLGAQGVVIGAMITRPEVITKRFVTAIQDALKR